MNHRTKNQLMCRLEGCPHEVLFKAVESPGYNGDPLERRASIIRDRNGNVLPGRGSPAGGPGGYNRYSSAGQSTVASPFCQAHTCTHFYQDETCTQLKPSHDSVCAYHARCPVADCNQARLQYLDPAYESRETGPVYQRWDYCADHKCTIRRCRHKKQSPKVPYCRDHMCQADGCKSQRLDQTRNFCKEHQCKQERCETIVEGKYAYCTLHIKCDISNCNRARHNVAGTKDYLRFCIDHATCAVNRCTEFKIEQSLYCANHTCMERGCSKSSQSKPFCSEHCCAEVNCRYPRPWAANPNSRTKFCPLHTCRAQDCPEFVDRLAIFCRTHGCSKPKCHEEVIVEGFCLDHLKAHYINQGEHKARGTSPKDASPPSTIITRPNANPQPPTFPRRLSQQSLTRPPLPGQRPSSVLLHNHAHEILLPPSEHPSEHEHDQNHSGIKFLDQQQLPHHHPTHQAHVDDPDPEDLDDDEHELDDHLPNLNPSSLNSHLSHVSHNSHRSQQGQGQRVHSRQSTRGGGLPTKHSDYPRDAKRSASGGESGRSSRSSEAVSALSDHEHGDLEAEINNNGSLVNESNRGGGGSPGDPPEYSKVASSIISVGGHGDTGETKTGTERRREERERSRRAEREGGGGMPGAFGGEGKEDSDGW
ncbi:hypothetical protein B0T20DRAFT_56464 [Sordaria brevicollis]|uniref:Uncharacterized protein n=1 Tax=Sordaria brevicollis TaxID=83679 RepID=A0AAE0U6Q4_SORBR|nr:hypothetical protein B0T20DRAFT_56464 [Sordaria brevicollis]